MNLETFIKDYKNIKKQDIIEELYYKCKANRDYYVEIERLNNIINKLEEYLKKEQLLVLRNDNEPVYKYQEVLDKLKELKENK